MNVDEVKNLCEKYAESWDGLCGDCICGSYFHNGEITPDHWYELDEEYYDENDGKIKTMSINIVEEINKLGYVIKSEDGYGGEGRGDNYWGVFSLTKDNHTVYIKLDGYYASYNGSTVDYHDWNIVVPATKTVKMWKNA